MRLFVDTNVLFDIFAQREPFFEASQKVLIMQACGDADLWAAPQSYLDIFYILSGKAPANELQKKLGKSLERINLCETSHADIEAACSTGWDDLEDALIGLACAKIQADYLLTRDKKQAGFKALRIPALSPEEFFEHLAQTEGVTYGEMSL